MHVAIKIYKVPVFEVYVQKTATIRDLQISVLSYLRIPTTPHNLREIILLFRGIMCKPHYTLSSLHISENSMFFCHIKASSLEQITQTHFDDEIEDSNSNIHNLNFQSKISQTDRLCQSSTYIFEDNYHDNDDIPTNPSEFCFYYAQKYHDENSNQNIHSNSIRTQINIDDLNQGTLPLFNDLVLTKEDNHTKGHINQIKRYENLLNYSSRISEKQKYSIIRANSSYNINHNTNLSSSSFTSGENLSLNQFEPSCETLPCCFQACMPSSFSTTGISFLTNDAAYIFPSSPSNTANCHNSNSNNSTEDENYISITNSANDDNKNNDEDNNNNNNSNNNNYILGLDFSIKTEDQKSNF